MTENSKLFITMVIVNPLRIGLVLLEMACNRLNERLTKWGDLVILQERNDRGQSSLSRLSNN